MIQRIQTVFLALSALSTGAAFFTPIYDRAMEDPQLWIGYGLAIALTISMIGSIGCIFYIATGKTKSLGLSALCWCKLLGSHFV